MIETIGCLEDIEVLQAGLDPLLEGVELLHLVGPAGVGLGVVEHWLLVIHQRQQTGIEIRSRAWSATAKLSLILTLEFCSPSENNMIMLKTFSATKAILQLRMSVR